MKNIGVLVPDFSVEHCQDFVKGVIDYYSSMPDVNVFIVQTFFGHESLGVFNYQYWSTIEILKSKQINAYIIASGLYCSQWNKNKLQELVSKFDGRPVISSSVDLEMENTYSVINDSGDSYKEIVKHLKEIHGCKKIAFMSAVSTGSPEAFDRFEKFKIALKENQLDFDENLVFDGSFVEDRAKAAILNKLHSKEDLNFDSIVCSSDLMAIGCYHAFEELGISVPDDVKVVGFDNTIHACLCNPKLTTISQNIEAQGTKCAELALRAINGEKLNHINQSGLMTMYRQSCGCVEISNQSASYKDSSGKICLEQGKRGHAIDLYLDEILEKHKYASLLDQVKTANTLRQLYYNIDNIVNISMLKDMAICLYDEPLFLNKLDDSVMPSKVEMHIYSTKNAHEKFYRPGVIFNPKKVICPINSIREERGVYILYPIFSGEENYGYMVCKPAKSDFNAYTVNMRILATAISNSVEYTNNIMQKEQLFTENTNLAKTNTNLSMESKTDELTKILNRRGFMEIGQRSIDVIQELNNSCVVFFADMDGLKTIDDTYGHEMGDKAIKLQAEILSKAFRASDVVGRLSGDEFGIVANSMSIENVDAMRKKISKMCEEVSKANNLPFILSISMGAVDLSENNILTKLLTKADKLLYEEKRIKHGK